MRRAAWGCLLCLMLACPGLAEVPDRSPRPRPSPVAAPPAVAMVPVEWGTAETPLAVQAAALQGGQPGGMATSPRPRERPVLRVSASSVPQSALAVQAASDVGAVPRATAPAPAVMQEQIEPAAAIRILPGKSAVTGKKGSVCGDRAIKGETLAPITSRVRGCGIDDPVRVTSVDGVTLSQPAIINCDTAKALKKWVSKGLKPAFGRKDVVELRVAASYACRPRNNVKGAKISEHGRGNAIDISAIILANGKSISVAEDWRRSAGKPMKKAYRAACGTFGTTLGPEADRHHRDHLHFDVARHRGGAYCR